MLLNLLLIPSTISQVNNYYLTLVLKPNLEEKARKELLDSIKKGFEKMDKEDLWGQRPLAYPIKKQTSGYYAHFEFQAQPQVIRGLDKNLKVEEDILRYLLIRK